MWFAPLSLRLVVQRPGHEISSTNAGPSETFKSYASSILYLFPFVIGFLQNFVFVGFCEDSEEGLAL